MIRYPLTTAAIVLALIVLTAASLGHFNVIALPARLFARIGQSEIDDVVTSFLFVVAAFFVDQSRDRRRSRQAESLVAERLRVVQVTMRTVQDIVNNCLNGLQLMRMDAEGHVPTESLTLFDEVIQETAAKLQALGNLQAYAEKKLEIGMGLDFPSSVVLNPEHQKNSAEHTSSASSRHVHLSASI